jgi:hypothetical protein
VLISALQYTEDSREEAEARQALVRLRATNGFVGGKVVPVPGPEGLIWRTYAFYPDYGIIRPLGIDDETLQRAGFRLVGIALPAAWLGISLPLWQNTILAGCSTGMSGCSGSDHQLVSGLWVCRGCWEAADSIRRHQQQIDRQAGVCQVCHTRPERFTQAGVKVCPECMEDIRQAIREFTPAHVFSYRMRRWEPCLADYQELAVAGAQQRRVQHDDE